MKRYTLPLSASLMISFAGAAHASCGSAFCMLDTNWDMQGVVIQPGLRLDLRYEYIKQDQPMAGDKKIGVGEIPRHHNEVSTTNRNFVATADYTFNGQWAMSVQLPYLDRSHFHIHNHHGEQLPEQWDFSRLGDMRVLGRYQLSSESAAAQRLNFYGLNFGLKLPTGDKDIRNAAGDRAERTLQPGTGTADIVLGAFYSSILGQSNASWFAQALWQAPLNSSEDYRPGKRATLDLGYRYEATDRLGLMLQLNALWRGRDSGAQAEPEDSGGNFFFLSPGVSYAVGKGVQVYGFIQKPIYQYVNGVQLTATWSGAVGITARF